MFGMFANAGSGALGGARFTLINVLPGAFLVLIIVGAYRTHLYDSHGLVNLALALPPGWEAVELGVAMVLMGILAQPFQIAIVRMLEGYGWERRLPRVLTAMALERHYRRFAWADSLLLMSVRRTRDDSLTQAVRHAQAVASANRITSAAAELLDRYPADPDRILPTMLGNILRAGEDPAGERYGLRSMTVYPRMYPYLSDKLHQAIARQLDLIDATSAFCLSFVVAALATIPVVVIRHDWWSLIPIGFLGLALVAYKGAMNAAAGHGVLLAAAFDLHRFDLIRALRYPLPRTASEEWKFNSELSKFWQGQDPLFKGPDEPSDADLDLLRATPYDHETPAGDT
jgi:hypothetical protein